MFIPFVAATSVTSFLLFWSRARSRPLTRFYSSGLVGILEDDGLKVKLLYHSEVETYYVSMNRCVKTIVIIGDSFPARVLADSSLTDDFGLDNEFTRVQWCVHGGMTLDKLHRQYRRELELLAPFDGAILHIGSNDLCRDTVQSTMYKMVHTILPMLKSMQCVNVFVCQVFHRRKGRMTGTLNLCHYNAKVDDFNSGLKNMLSPVQYWAHDSVLKCGQLKQIWSADGVHFEHSKNKFMHKSLRGAVIHLTRWVFCLQTGV